MGVSHYDTMGLDPWATSAEIRDRYRDLVKVVHPDVGGDRFIPPAVPHPERWCGACGGARSGSCSAHSGGRCGCPRS
ncbi:MAG: J domain-containing protein [Actinomycetia bacterium]|nr:J domain-containing protein [Actinomycetes bacterium]MCP3911579.1 J domain-containing protein [Actinomycetes bacterium]